MGVRSSGLGSLRIIEPGGRVPVVCVSIGLGLLVRGKREESGRCGALEDLPRRPRCSSRFGSEQRCGRSLNEAGLHCDGKRFLQVKITTDPLDFPRQSSMCRDKHNVLQMDQLQKKKKNQTNQATYGHALSEWDVSRRKYVGIYQKWLIGGYVERRGREEKGEIWI